MMLSKMLRPATVGRVARRMTSRMSSTATRNVRQMGSDNSANNALRLTAAVFAGVGAFALTTIPVQADAKEAPEHEKLIAEAKKVLKSHEKLAAEAAQQVLWNAIRKDIEAIIEDENSVNPGVDGFPGNSGGGGDVGPMFVRLAWHCGGSYDAASGTGGTNGGTMRFKPESDHGGNAGLGHARALLEPIKKKYGALGATYADIYVFAGCVALETMGCPALPFRPGRTDADGPATPEQDKRFSPDGRLPDADGRNTDPATHLRDIFHRMGFNDRDIVALSGAHALGRCHTDRSGFWGPWTFAPTTFANQYFVVLTEQDWFIKRTHKGAKWTGPLQYEDTTGEVMMLPTDMALLNDREFLPVVREYVSNEDKFHADFAAAWTKLTENGCEEVLGDVVIVNLEDVVHKSVSEDIEAAVEKFRAAFGEVKTQAKKKGWFW